MSSFKSTEDQQQSAERAAGHDRGLSLDGALQAARGVRRVATGIRGRSSGVKPGVPQVQCDLPDALDGSRDEPEELLCPSREPCSAIQCFAIRDTYERALSYRTLAQRGQGPAHASRPEQHEGDAELGVRKWCRLGWTSTRTDARRVGQSRALEPSKDDGTRILTTRVTSKCRTWRAMCPELQEKWPRRATGAPGKGWRGKRPGGGARVEDFDLTERCRRRSGSSRRWSVEPLRQSADERAGGDRAAHAAGGLNLTTISWTSCVGRRSGSPRRCSICI